MPKKIRLGILFGGRSGEHEVSLESAASILKAIDREKYDIVPIGITREGRWVLGSGTAELSPKALTGVLQNGRAISPPADPTRRELTPLAAPSRGIKDHAALDVVFPVLHGTFGEDGTVQGLLDLADVPYVGAGVLGSATGMDKDVMKRLFRDAGLPVVPWILLLRSELIAHPARARQRVAREIGYPAFVKPANLGSSVGISKVHDPKELRAAIALAAKFDRKIIVEKAIDAREIECAVLGNDTPQASIPGEIVPANEFYDYQAKYVKEGSRLIIPAKLGAARTLKVRDLALRAFKAIDCAGMGRVDFLMDRHSGKLYVNEINTIPGFTSISMYPKLWEASGLPYAKLIDRLVELAIERHRDKSRTQHDYKTLGS